MFLLGLGVGVGTFLVALVIYVLAGALIGFIAGKIMDSENNNFVSNAILGIVGSVAGGFVGRLLHVNSSLISFIIAIACSCLVVFIVRKINNSN